MSSTGFRQKALVGIVVLAGGLERILKSISYIKV